MAWDFFAHTRTLELLYHKMQAPVLEEYHLTQIELDVLLFLSHHPQQDTAKDIVEIRRLTKSHVSAAVEGLVQRQYLQRLRRPDNKKLIHLVLLPDAMPAVQAGQARQREFFQTLKKGFEPQEVQVLNAMLKRMGDNAKEAYAQLYNTARLQKETGRIFCYSDLSELMERVWVPK